MQMEVHATENTQAWVPKTKPKWSLALEYHSPAPSPIHLQVFPFPSSLSPGLFWAPSQKDSFPVPSLVPSGWEDSLQA